MKQEIIVPKNVDEYIAGFPKQTQQLLMQIRHTITKAAPDAVEVLSYHMPAYKLQGMLVYFAGYKNHIGFYPGATGIEHFKKEISGYKSAKGSVQFPLDEPIPVELVSKITLLRAKENAEKSAAKMMKK